MKKSILAIIPARGGSKRIPRKNIKDFLGKPIIAYSIEAAIESGIFEEVMVSTDDEEIAKVAKHYGASVPFMRSAVNSNDFATTYDVLEEVILKYQSNGVQFDVVSCIYPTSPFVTSNILKEAYDKMVLNKNDIIFPVMKFSFPIQRALRVVGEKIEMILPENLNVRSQDLETTFHDAGQFYFFTTKDLLKNKKMVGENSGYIEISELEGQDIDHLSDWKLAEMKFKLLNKSL